MNNKEQLNKIRSEYNCQGDVIFRTAIQYIVEYGQANFKDNDWFQKVLNGTNERHDKAEAEGKHLFIGRDFELAILECAKKLAEINSYDLLIYIQREVYLSNEGIDPQRAIQLLKNCMSILVFSHDDSRYIRSDFRDADFNDDELEILGYGYLIEEEECDD